MTDRPTFETKLTRAFAAYADGAPTDVNAFAVVADASRGRAAGRWSWSSPSRRWLVPVLVGLLLLALAAGALLVGRSPSITVPVLGHVAFARGADVYVAAADGGAATRILQGDPNCRVIGDCWWEVGWSASGEFLAASDAQRVVIVRPDGREVRRFEGAKWFNWSPTDDRIAMAGDRRLFVGRATADGLDELQVPEGTSHGFGWGNAWAADGQSILGPWKKASDSFASYLWLIPTDGTSARRLTSTPVPPYLELSWSPDGSRVAYSTQVCTSTEHCTGDIYVMQRDGTGLINVTNDVPQEDWPIWSPDSARIVFKRQDDGLFIAAVGPVSGSPDRAPLKRLTSVPGDTPISWGPDGRQILFSRHIPGDYPDTGSGAGFRNEVWAIDADGSGEHLVASDTEFAAWQWLPARTSAP